MIYSALNRSILASFFIISLSQAMEMEVEEPRIACINPADIDATNTIAFQGGAFRGCAPYKIIDIEALKEMGNQNIIYLDLSSSADQQELKFIFKKDVIETIFTNFPNLTFLDLSNNNLSPLAMEYLLDHLKTNDKIETLKLSNTSFCKSGPLFRTMIDFPVPNKETAPNPGTRNVIIAGNDEMKDPKYREENNFMMMMEAQANPEKLPIYHLDGSVNTVNYDAKMLCELLKVNTSIKELNLSHNAVESTDLPTILDGLKTNKALKHLYLDGNKIAGDGIEELKHFTNEQGNSLNLTFNDQNTNEDRGNNECVIC